MKTPLQKLQAKYSKLCEKLERMNEEAFEMEKEMQFLMMSETPKDEEVKE